MVTLETETTQDYGAIYSPDEFKKYVQGIINRGGTFGFDIESGYEGLKANDISKLTFHPRWMLVGFSFTDSTEWARYVPIAHDTGENMNAVAAARLLWMLLNTGRGVAHNASFELQGLSRWFREVLWDDIFFGEAVRKSHGFYPILSDTMIEAFMVQEYEPLQKGNGVGLGLKGLTRHVFGHQMEELKDLFPDLKKAGTLKQLRFNTLELNERNIAYACEDSVWCLALHELHYPVVRDMTMFKAEMQLLPVLCEMEQEGLALDWDEYARRFDDTTEFKIAMNEQIQADLSERLGELVSVNFNSPPQTRELLYEKLGLPVQYDPKTKKPSTGKVALRNLMKMDPVINEILEWRGVAKLVSAYIKKYREQLSYDPEGRARPNHKQVGAGTGRMSVDHVSYQQWPKPYHWELKDGTTYDLNYRNFLIAPEGYRIVGFDFSQVELRVLAGMANETALLEAFAAGVDIHSATASTMMGIPLDEITEKDRAKGKTLNFAVVYGSGADNIASMLGITKEEAQALLDKYFETFSGLRAWMDERVIEGQQQGVVYTRFGRKFKVWEYVDADRNAKKAVRAIDPEEKKKFQKFANIARSKADRMCVNAPVQGGAADYLKLGMIRTQAAIKKAGLQDKIRLFMTVHDALEFYVHESITTQQVIDLVGPCVSFPVEGLPVIRADWHEGARWGEVFEIDFDDNQQIAGYEFKHNKIKYKVGTYEDALAKLEELKQMDEALPEEIKPLDAHLFFEDMPMSDEWERFKAYLSERPGPSKITLHFPGLIKELETTAAFIESDAKNIESILSGVRVDLQEPLDSFDDVDLHSFLDHDDDDEDEDE